MNELKEEEESKGGEIKKIEETKVTHLSTWFATSSEDIASRIRPLIGEEI